MRPGLAAVREAGGRLFILGVGGSAGHASHAVNDFRKLCGFEAYAPTDNVSELTARINDEGWDTTFAAWLRASRLGERDGLLVFSVGGGSREKNVSVNLVRALELAQQVGAAVFGIVGRDGGFTAEVADACVVIPPLVRARITPHTEGLCAVVWHLLVSHPALAGAHQVGDAVRSDAATIEDRRRRATRFFIVGGAGFIGSHFVDRLLARPRSSRSPSTTTSPPAGRGISRSTSAIPGLRVVRGDVERPRRSDRRRWPATTPSIHLASNPDIARAATEPAIDFDEGTLLTHHVVEAMRQRGRSADPLRLRQRRLRRPRRPRGGRGPRAAGPGLDLRRQQAGRRGADRLLLPHVRPAGCAFRFGNVVGPRQTHGVGFDFVRRLLEDSDASCASSATARRASPTSTSTTSSTPCSWRRERAADPFEAFNVATGDYITVTRDRRPGRGRAWPRPAR